MENTIQFLIENQSRFHSDLEMMKEAQQETTAQIKALAENTNAQIQALTESQQALSERVDDIVGVIDVMRVELRESFDNLIIANEVTRKLAEDVAQLAINTSQRVTRLEEQNGSQ